MVSFTKISVCWTILYPVSPMGSPEQNETGKFLSCESKKQYAPEKRARRLFFYAGKLPK